MYHTGSLWQGTAQVTWIWHDRQLYAAFPFQIYKQHTTESICFGCRSGSIYSIGHTIDVHLFGSVAGCQHLGIDTKQEPRGWGWAQQIHLTPHLPCWPTLPKAQFTQDVEHLATCARKLWNTLWSTGVFTQLASNIKGFACKFASKCAHVSYVEFLRAQVASR